MKLIIEVQLTDQERRKDDHESILVEKLYNTCDSWINGNAVPELKFIYDDEDYDDLDKDILDAYYRNRHLN